MPIPLNIETLALLAAVISAASCVFAARAAFKAQAAAVDAQLSLRALERRVALRDIATLVGELLVEGGRTNTLAGQVILLHRSLVMVSGDTQSSALEIDIAATYLKRDRVQKLAEVAKPYAESTASLDQSSPDHIDKVHVLLTATLQQIRALREELESEHTQVEASRVHRLEQMEKARASSTY